MIHNHLMAVNHLDSRRIGKVSINIGRSLFKSTYNILFPSRLSHAILHNLITSKTFRNKENMHPLQAAMKWALKHHKFESEADKRQHYRDLAKEHEEFFNLLEEKLYFYPQQFWTRKLVLHIISIHNRECCASPEDEIHIIDPRDSDVEFVQAIHDFHADLKKLDDVRNASMAADKKYAQASPKQQRKVCGHVRTSKDLWGVSYQSMLAKMNAHYRDIREDENSFPGLMNASLSDPIWGYIAELTDKIEKGLREDASDVSDPTGLDPQEDFGEDDNRSDASGGTESTLVRNNINGSDPRTKSLRRWPNQKFSEIEVLLVIYLEEILYAQNLNSPTIRDIGEKTNAALKHLVSLAKGKQADTETLTDGLPLPSAAEVTFSDVSMARMVVHYIKELRKYNLEIQQPLLQLAKKLTERYEVLEESGDNYDVFKLVLKVREASSLYERDLREYNIKQDQELPIDPEVLRWSNIIVHLEKEMKRLPK
jgi:hypothetical protein